MKNFRKYSWVFVVLILLYQPVWADLPVDPLEWLEDDDDPYDNSIENLWLVCILMISSVVLFFRHTKQQKRYEN